MPIIFVGQSPSKRAAPTDEPFSGKSGAAVADLMGITPAEFRAAFTRVNLIPSYLGKNGRGDKFDAALARPVAATLAADPDARLVLLGKNVARCFAVDKRRTMAAIAPLTWERLASGATAIVLPHPSGLNRWYNVAANKTRAREFLRSLWAAVLVD